MLRSNAMQSLLDAVDEVAERTGFSGVVRVDRAGETELSAAYGFADRAHGVLNTVATQFATASGTKEPAGRVSFSRDISGWPT